MEVDWRIVKTMTLWSYEELTNKILKVLSYDFVQENYNHDMERAGIYVTQLLSYDQKYKEYIIKLKGFFQKLRDLNVENYTDLIARVETREKCAKFVEETKLPFKDLISVLNYIFRWVLPFRNVYLRQLIDETSETHKDYISKLSEQGIKFNLDILAHGRTQHRRVILSQETGIPETFVLDLVKRADLTRLPYMSRKTVLHLFGAEYDTIEKLAKVNVEKLKRDMKAYFNKKGIRLGSFIDIAGLVFWARATPKIVKM